MKYKINFYPLLISLILFSCNVPGIFDTNSNNNKRDSETPVGKILFSVNITGGIAGINDKLLIDEHGFATFESLFQNTKKWEVQLSESQLIALHDVMITNDFFELDSLYIDQNVADAFYYDIFYTSEGNSNRVNTDGFASPENLNNIIEEIYDLIDLVRNNGLDFGLELSKSSLEAGESVTFKFTYSNVNSEELTLQFNDGQIYDFFVYSTDGTADNRRMIWNWAADKAFTLALWKLTLQPGESKVYEVSWDGTNNQGNSVAGDFLVRAKLVSTPGGQSNLVNLQVRK